MAQPWSLLSWPSQLFKKRVPVLHRALDEPLGREGEPAYEEGIVVVDELATRRRVRKKDAFKRNALHIAVRPAYTAFCCAPFVLCKSGCCDLIFSLVRGRIRRISVLRGITDY
jgi:hypothetical protein